MRYFARILAAGLSRLSAARWRLRGAPIYGAVFVGLLAIAFVWAAVLQRLTEEKTLAERAAQQNAANLARSFEEHVVRSFTTIDQTLLDLRAAYVADPKHFDIAAWSRTNRSFADLILQVSIIAKDGHRIATSTGAESSQVDLSDREYFQRLAHSTRDELVISEPISGRSSGKPSVPLARRITAPDGSFAGVAVVSVDPDYFARFYDSIDVGRNGAVVLIGMDRIVRARAAFNKQSVGESLAQSPLWAMHAKNPVGTFRSNGLIDGVVRLFSYREVKGFPLIVEVGFAEDEVLADYRHDRATRFISAILLSLIFLAFTVLMVRREARLQSTREALSASEHKYRSVVDNLSEVVFQVDEDGRWTFLNPAWSEVTGLAIDDSLGNSAFAFIDQRDRPLYAKRVQPVLDGACDSARQDIRFRAKDGSVRWLDLNARAMRDSEGRLVGLLGTMNDITQRHAAEDALRDARDTADRATRAKSDFLASMSHEIRSPMNAVIGIVDLLRDTSLDTEQGQMVELVRDSAASLMRILDDILDFSKIEAGAISIVSEPTDFRQLVKSVLEAIAHTASAKGLALEVEVAADVPDAISIDPLRLRQILVNLLANAIKFTAEGSVRLTVSREAADAGAETLVISVIDTGIGIEPEVAAGLFQPFVQADASTTRTYGGTGLGLSISRRLARLLGGDLTLVSGSGEGSNFSLRLPLLLAEMPAEPEADDLATTAPPGIAGARVLVAEDMPTNRWLVKRQLERFGLSVDLVENGHAALAALSRADYRLLITDCHMPGLDGVTLASEIRDAEDREGRERLPILGLTADITGNMRERCLAAGMDDVISKPTNLRRLEAALQAVLLGRPATSAPTDLPADDVGAVLDLEVYRELFSDGDADGPAWLQSFLDAAVTMVAEIERQVAPLDREELVDAAHRLAGAALFAGATRLGQACRQLESAAPAALPEAIGALVDAVGDAFAAARVEALLFMAMEVEPAA